MIEKVFDKNGQLIAIIFNLKKVSRSIREGETLILTPDPWGIQTCILSREKGYYVKPHLHYRERILGIGVEILLVLDGVIKVCLYDNDGNLVKCVNLEKGMCIIMRCPHEVEYVKDSKVLEIKEGPYPGPERDKVFI